MVLSNYTAIAWQRRRERTASSAGVACSRTRLTSVLLFITTSYKECSLPASISRHFAMLALDGEDTCRPVTLLSESLRHERYGESVRPRHFSSDTCSLHPRCRPVSVIMLTPD
jgi:hypothetical protein